ARGRQTPGTPGERRRPIRGNGRGADESSPADRKGRSAQVAKPLETSASGCRSRPRWHYGQEKAAGQINLFANFTLFAGREKVAPGRPPGRFMPPARLGHPTRADRGEFRTC